MRAEAGPFQRHTKESRILRYQRNEQLSDSSAQRTKRTKCYRCSATSWTWGASGREDNSPLIPASLVKNQKGRGWGKKLQVVEHTETTLLAYTTASREMGGYGWNEGLRHSQWLIVLWWLGLPLYEPEVASASHSYVRRHTLPTCGDLNANFQEGLKNWLKSEKKNVWAFSDDYK